MDPDDVGGVGGGGGDVPVKPKRGPGRPPGSKSKVKPAAEPVTRGVLRAAVGRTFSPEKLEQMLRQLSPAELARLLASIEPRVKEEPTAGTFVMIVDGLGSKLGKAYCPRCGWNSDEGTGGLLNHNGEVPIPPRRPSVKPQDAPVVQNEEGGSR